MAYIKQIRTPHLCKECGKYGEENFYVYNKYTCKRCCSLKSSYVKAPKKQKPEKTKKIRPVKIQTCRKCKNTDLSKFLLPNSALCIKCIELAEQSKKPRKIMTAEEAKNMNRIYNNAKKQVPKGVKELLLKKKYEHIVSLLDENSYINPVGRTGYGVLLDKGIEVKGIFFQVERRYITVTVRESASLTGRSLGRHLLNLEDPNLFCDHINHNPLDNRLSNLRVVTRSQNMMNRSVISGKMSNIYKGVYVSANSVSANIHKEDVNYWVTMDREQVEYIASVIHDVMCENLHGEYGTYNHDNILDISLRDFINEKILSKNLKSAEKF